MQAAGDAPIIDPGTQSQFDSALRVAEIELTNWKLAKLDDSFPGYKTSPENYARLLIDFGERFEITTNRMEKL